MGTDDKIKNAADEAVGHAKEAIGTVTDNDSLKNEGKLDQAGANLRQAGENVADAARDALK